MKYLYKIFKWVIVAGAIGFVILFLWRAGFIVFYFLLLGFKLASCIICWEFLKNLFSNHNSKGK